MREREVSAREPRDHPSALEDGEGKTKPEDEVTTLLDDPSERAADPGAKKGEDDEPKENPGGDDYE